MPYSFDFHFDPTCLLFLIDRSGSMSDPFGGPGRMPKANLVADVVNDSIGGLIATCTIGKTPTIRDYYSIGVIGYGATVGPAFRGPLAGRGLVPISEVEAAGRHRDRIETVDDGIGGLVEIKRTVKEWLEPVADGGTPMSEALRRANALLEPWIADHRSSSPPIVINITDGEPTDGDPTPEARALTNLATGNGNVLLFNCHISSRPRAPIAFPESDAGLPDRFARLLFNMSSVLPETCREIARGLGADAGERSRGFVFDADLGSLKNLLDIAVTRGHLQR